MGYGVKCKNNVGDIPKNSQSFMLSVSNISLYKRNLNSGEQTRAGPLSWGQMSWVLFQERFRGWRLSVKEPMSYY